MSALDAFDVVRAFLACAAIGWLPGIALAAWLFPRAATSVRSVVGLALGPLVASVLGLAPFAFGVRPFPIAAGLVVVSLLAWGIAVFAQRKSADSSSEPTDTALRDPLRPLVIGLAVFVAACVALPPLAHEWARVKGDSWDHAGIVYQILERGIPPEDPRWAGLHLNYVWIYNFFVALVTGAGNTDPFVVMSVFNVVNSAVTVLLAALAGRALWRSDSGALGTALLTTFGLNAGAWLLWPLQAIRGMLGEVRGWPAIAAELRAPELASWRVLYELAAPFAHMVSFLDKFLTGTALSYAWIQMLLVVWGLVLWLSGGPRATLCVIALGAAGMLLVHGVVGLSVLPVLFATIAIALIARSRWRWLPKGTRLLALGGALAVGFALAAPYTWSISRGWGAAQSGMAHHYLWPSFQMTWTILTACGVAFALAWSQAGRLIANRSPAGGFVVLAALAMTGFALVVNLPLDNESKFAFEVFFLLCVLAGPAFVAWLQSLVARFGRVRAGLVTAILFAVPFALTIVGFTVDRSGEREERTTVGPAERRLYAWLQHETPRNAVVVDDRYRNLAMVFARRQLYCGSTAGPELAGLPAADRAERHEVQDDLFGAAKNLDRDAERLGRFARPAYVIARRAEPEGRAAAIAFSRRPERFRLVHDAEGFVVYSVDTSPHDPRTNGVTLP